MTREILPPDFPDLYASGAAVADVYAASVTPELIEWFRQHLPQAPTP